KLGRGLRPRPTLRLVHRAFLGPTCTSVTRTWKDILCRSTKRALARLHRAAQLWSRSRTGAAEVLTPRARASSAADIIVSSVDTGRRYRPGGPRAARVRNQPHSLPLGHFALAFSQWDTSRPPVTHLRMLPFMRHLRFLRGRSSVVRSAVPGPSS